MTPRRHKLYDRLHEKYKKQGYRYLTPQQLATVVNTVIRELPEKESLTIASLIYSIMLHHERLRNTLDKQIACGGTMLAKTGGTVHAINRIEPILQQLIFIFMEEVTSGTCPEFV